MEITPKQILPAFSPSSSLALLVGNCDVIAFVENIQQGPGRKTRKLKNTAIFNQENKKSKVVQLSTLYLISAVCFTVILKHRVAIVKRPALKTTLSLFRLKALSLSAGPTCFKGLVKSWVYQCKARMKVIVWLCLHKSRPSSDVINFLEFLSNKTVTWHRQDKHYSTLQSYYMLSGALECARKKTLITRQTVSCDINWIVCYNLMVRQQLGTAESENFKATT